VIGTFGNKSFAFIGMERVGGVMVYDVSNPTAPIYVTYLNTRSGLSSDRGPEGLTLIAADKSPNGKPLLIIGNEVSGSTSIVQLNFSYYIFQIKNKPWNPRYPRLFSFVLKKIYFHYSSLESDTRALRDRTFDFHSIK
jgi:hypothetical protein